MPELASELQTLLNERGEAALAAQVRDLHLVDRCRCGDDFCATLYLAPRPVGSWQDLGQHRNLMLNAEQGMIVLDLVDDRIVCVEVLDRPEVREKLVRVLP